MTTWPQVLSCYEGLVRERGAASEPMLALVRFLASPRYAAALFPRVADEVLRVGRSREFAAGSEELRISFDEASQRFHFTHLRGPAEANPWTRDCEASEWQPVLLRLLHKRLQWFHEG
jgi:hypothetical protein